MAKTPNSAIFKNPQPFLKDEEQPIFTKFHPLEKKMTYIRMSYFNDQLNLIFRDYPNLKKINVHGFRHTHASLLFESGAEPHEVQDRLGHEDIQTNYNIYTHVTNKSREKTAEQFLNYMTNE